VCVYFNILSLGIPFDGSLSIFGIFYLWVPKNTHQNRGLYCTVGQKLLSPDIAAAYWALQIFLFVFSHFGLFKAVI
jgi:hypothetical protein